MPRSQHGPAPIYVRAPALALSLAVAGFLVFQAGLPGCGPGTDKPVTDPSAPATPAEHVASPAGDSQAVDPETPMQANAPDEARPKPDLGDADEPAAANAAPGTPSDKGNSNNKANDETKPRFFPASKAMAPLIEREQILPNTPPVHPAQQEPAPQQVAPVDKQAN